MVKTIQNKKMVIECELIDIIHLLAAKVFTNPDEIVIYHNDGQLMHRIGSTPYSGKHMDDDNALQYVIDNKLLPEVLDLT